MSSLTLCYSSLCSLNLSFLSSSSWCLLAFNASSSLCLSAAFYCISLNLWMSFSLSAWSLSCSLIASSYLSILYLLYSSILKSSNFSFSFSYCFFAIEPLLASSTSSMSLLASSLFLSAIICSYFDNCSIYWSICYFSFSCSSFSRILIVSLCLIWSTITMAPKFVKVFILKSRYSNFYKITSFLILFRLEFSLLMKFEHL